MNKLLLILSLLTFGLTNLSAQHAVLRQHGSCKQLVVDGKPFIVLGGELGNSSASSEADIERIFPYLERMQLNTVLVPTYWDLIEPQEGVFDFSLTDEVIYQARKNNLKVIFLWFGAWKNSMSCYAPEWFKRDYEKYPRAHTSTGRPLEIASVFSDNVFRADNNAFSQWMSHIASIDNEQGTVIMIQLENEIGMLEEARDHSSVADSLFASPIPQQLIEYMNLHCETLNPHLLERWRRADFRTSGSWAELFGDDIYTDEIFMAWHYASYVEGLAQTARATYDIPLYVNAAMNSRGRKPGEYPSAGPLAHLMDVWRCAAPSIDIISPDIYDDGFKDWVSQYHTNGNPLFIPECKATDNNGARAFYVFGEHDAIGISPFSIEDVSIKDNLQFVKGYMKLREIAPLLLKYQGGGCMHGLLFSQEYKERVIEDGDLRIVCRHNFTLPWDSRATDGSVWPEGGAILIRLSAEEYILSGNGVVVEFQSSSTTASAGTAPQLGEDGFIVSGGATDGSGAENRETSRVGLASVDEVTVKPDATLTFVRRLSGDQTHQGRHVRISVGDYKTLYIRLYTYKWNNMRNFSKKKVMIAVAMALCFGVTGADAKVKLPAVISDGMVIQRERPVTLWGTADEGEVVNVSFLKKKYSVTADSSGRWSVTLPAQKPGGPYQLTVNDITLNDVLVGDVWLCSGQSNMELPVSRVTDMFADEVASYENSKIRQFRVPNEYNFHAPQADINGKAAWCEVKNPEVMNFSALAYFFAKAMYEKTGVPVGIVNSSWGGTCIECWISEETIAKFPKYLHDKWRYEDDNYVKGVKDIENYNYYRWNLSLYRGDAGLHETPTWYAADYDDSSWQSVDMFSRSWASNGLNPINGSHWFRKDVQIPESWSGKDATLRLGCIVDADSVFVNGTFVGNITYQYPPRIYKVPAGLLHSGKNNVTVRLISNGGFPSFVKEKPYKLICDGEEVGLEGEWRHRVGCEMPSAPSTTFFNYKPVGLYNSMIAPIEKFTYSGVVWYQGESNVSNRNEYVDMLTALMADWRAKFSDSELPFYIVELADFLSHDDVGGRRAWAEMRAEQAKAAEQNEYATLIKNSDLGEWNDIHPLDKKTLGNRVAEAAWNDIQLKNINKKKNK